MEMAPIEPYKINISDDRLSRLKQKLALADFPDELEDAAWDYGSPLADIKKLTAYWKDSFDWRKAESKLNELPHFTTDIDVDGFGTFKVHFVRQKSSVEGAIPLLFVHGWPGSFIEVSKMIGDLTKGGADQPAFDVVVSIPIPYMIYPKPTPGTEPQRQRSLQAQLGSFFEAPLPEILRH